MPELPEVETIRRQLAPHLTGRTIASAQILDPRWTLPQPWADTQAELRQMGLTNAAPQPAKPH